MKFKKRTWLITTLILATILIFKDKSITRNKIQDYIASAMNEENIDLTPPDIDKINPNKCQQYIIGKPKISVNFNDSSGVDLSSIKLYINYKDVTKECKITDNKITYTPNKKLKRGSQIAKIELSDLSPNKNKKEFEWYFTVGTPIYTHYRGLLHAHTSNSDGHGTYEDAYYVSKYKSDLDFFAITEHSNYFDNDLKCNLDDASFSKKWTSLISTSKKYTTDGEFIALDGFEMTYDSQIKNPKGHINIFNTDGFVSRNDEALNLKNFYSLISNYDELIGQFNHPNSKFGNFEDFKYSPQADKVICLLEVGNGSNKDISKNKRAHNMYQKALDKGWHIAPTCNQDNHKMDFGIANEYRTVVLSTDLTKEALYDGLRNMRVYATEDKNLKIDYTINDSHLGSTLNKPSKLNFSICAVDNDFNDKINEIQVISNEGKIIKSKKFNSNLAKLEFNLKSNTNTFYYVKVIQNGDKISVTAPIWIKK